MSHTQYTRQEDGNYSVSFGSENNYSHLDDMDHLINNQKRNFLDRNWKWWHILIAVLTACLLTVGVCYLFFSLGKEKSQGKTQPNVGTQFSKQTQGDILKLITNSSMSDNDFNYWSELFRAESLQFKSDVTKLLKAYSSKLMSKEDGENLKSTLNDNKQVVEELKSIINDMKNSTQQGMTNIKDSRDTILKMLKSIQKNRSDGSPDASQMRDCLDWKRNNYTESGVYTINPTSSLTLEVYCDMKTDGGGWIVFQRRIDGSTDFFRNWTEYENGFGSNEYEFWLGNRNLHVLTSINPTELRIDLKDWDGAKRYAKYSTFKIGDAASKYTLYAQGYSGDAGDGLALHHEVKFSTLDQDNDIKRKDCANTNKGAWWFENCSHASLNGEYIKGGSAGKNKGINWEKWKGDYYSLKFSTMMFRRKF